MTKQSRGRSWYQLILLNMPLHRLRYWYVVVRTQGKRKNKRRR